MFTIKSDNLGKVTIVREVIENIAGLSAVGCYGLVGMVPQNIQRGITSILGIDSIRKGVSCQDSEQGLIINLYVVAGYGVNISEVAHNVSQQVKYEIERNTGLKVHRVNLHVKGVKVIKEKG